VADQRITQLQPLTEAEVAATDVLPIVDISASENKKVTAKDLFEAGAALADNSSIDIAKINQASTTKLGAAAIAPGAVTAVKLAANSTIVYNSVEPVTDNFTGRGYVNSTDKNFKIYDGAIYQQVVSPSAGIANDAVTTVKIIDGAITTSKIDPAGLTTAAFGDLAITGAKLANSTITSGKLATGAVNSAAIEDLAIVSSKIADSAVITQKINAGAVTGVKLAANSATVIAATPPAGNGSFTGQQWFNTANGVAHAWDGSQWVQQAGVQSIVFTDTTPLSFSSAVSSAGVATITSQMEVQAATRVLAGPISGADAVPTFRAIVGTDLPVATSVDVGVSKPGTGITVDGNGVLNHTNSVAPGTYTKVTVDGQGHVTTGTTLAAADIPEIAAEKITSGTLSTALIGTKSLSGIKFADASTTLFGGAGSTSNIVTFPTAEFKGQHFFDEINGDLYLWSGSAWRPITVTAGELIYGGTYNATTNQVASVTGAGTSLGLTVSSALPNPSAANKNLYVVVATNGTGTTPAPVGTLEAPDILVSNGNETNWERVRVSTTVTSVTTPTATQVSCTSTGSIAATNVQAAIAELEAEKLALTGGTITGVLEIGSAGSLVFEGSTEDTNETTITVANPTADRSIVFPNQSGNVLVSGNASIVNADISATAAIADTKLATLSTANKVDLSAVSISGASGVDGVLVDSDLFPVCDLSTGTNGRVSLLTLRQKGYTGVSGDITINSSGVAAISGGSIVDADINSSAGILVSKLSVGFLPAVPRRLLQTNAGGTAAEWTSNVDIPGTLDVTGATILDSTLVVAGAITASSNVTLNAQADLRWADADSSNWVAFQAPSTVNANVTWTLPAADGTAQQALVTNGSGTLSFANAGGAYYYRLDANLALQNLNTAQDVFGVGVALLASTVYEFEAVIALQRPSASYASHSVGFGLAELSGLTVNNVAYYANSTHTSTAGVTAPDTCTYTSTTANTAVTPTIGATTSNLYLRTLIKGTISVNAAGTLKPQVTFSTAPGSAQVYSVLLGSFFKIWPIGTAGSNSSAGTWA
jgi:hypothetical protein